MIFTYLLVLDQEHQDEEFENPTNRWMSNRYCEPIHTAILCVCRQFLNEGLILLYSKNDFHFDNARDVIGFSYLQQRSLNTRLITSLYLSFRIANLQDVHELLLLLDCGHFKNDFPPRSLKALKLEFLAPFDEPNFSIIEETLKREYIKAVRVWISGAGKRGDSLMDALSTADTERPLLQQHRFSNGIRSTWVG